MKHYILISLFCGALLSCTKTIDFDDEGYANQVVVNSFISTENYFSAYITKSSSILENEQNNPPAEGSMDLYEDGTLIRQFPSQVGGFAATDIVPKAGKTYRMEITSEGKKLETETTIPYKVEVISIDTMTVKDQFINKRLRVNVKIKDIAGDNFYRITVSRENLFLVLNADGKGTRKYFRTTSEEWISSDSPVFKSLYNNFGGEEFDMGPSNDYNIFPDDYFKGKEYTIQFFVNNYRYGNYMNPYYGGNENGSKTIYDRHTVHIQHLSKEIFNYMKYLKLYNHYHDNPFSEPVPVFSNVKGGAGIFAGYNDNAKFQFEKIYIPFSMDTIKVEDGYYYGGGY